MSKSVEFEVLLKTGKFREAAQESKKAIEDVGSAVSGSSSAMSEEFTDLKAQLDLQKEIIRTLREEIGKLEAALKNVSPGNEWSNVTAEIGNLNQELDREDQGLIELQGQVEQTEQKHVSLRTQLREVREELVAMEMAGKRGTEEYRELQERAGALTDAMGDATAQMNIMAHDQRGMQGIISGLTGVSGAFSAAAGAASMFGSENENLQKVMLKVQSLMAITVGLQQVQQTLDKDSAFRLVTINGLKEWWVKVVREASVAESAETVTMTTSTAATTAAGTAATGAAGGFKLLGTAIKSIPGIGWVLTAISAVITAVGILVKKQKEARKAQQEAVEKSRKEMADFQKAVGDAAIESVNGIERLASEYKRLGNDMSAKKKFISENSAEFDKLGVSIKNVADAEDLLIKNKDKFIHAQIAKATAEVYGERIKQIMRDNISLLGVDISKRTNGMLGGEMFSSAKEAVQVGRARELWKEIGQLQEEAIKQQKKASELLGENGLKATETSTSFAKSVEQSSESNVVGWQAKLAKLTAERNKAVSEMKSLVGKTIHYDFGDVTYDAESIKEDLEKIESDFQNAVYELAKDYGLEFKVPVEVTPGDSSYQDLLDQYADYKRKEASINKQYDEQVANANGDATLIEKINEARRHALTGLSMEALKASDAFGALYNNAGRLGNSLKKLLTDRVKELVNFISSHKGDLTFATVDNASRFGISTEALANLLQSDDALKALVNDLDAIENSDAISGLTKAIQKLKEAKAQAKNGDLVSEEDVAKAEDAVMDAVGRVKGAIVSELSNIGEALRDMGEYLDNDSLKEAGDILSDILGNFQAAESGAQAWGGWWGAIIGGVTDLIPKIVKYATASNDLEEGLNNLSASMQHLESDLSLLDARMQNGISTEQILEKWKLVYYEMENVREQYWLALSNHNDEEARQYLNDYWSFVEELKGVWGEYYEYLSGTSVSGVFDDISDMIWDAFDSGKDAIDDFEQYFNEMLVNMIRKQVLWNTIGDRMQQYIEDLTYQISEGNLTGDNAQDYINWLRSYGEDIMQEGQAALEAIAPIIEGLTSSVEDAGTLSGSIQGITSEQAGMLAGQMNAMRTAQAAQTALLTDQLEALNDIEHNTRYVRDIYNFLRQNNVGANSNLNRAYGQN